MLYMIYVRTPRANSKCIWVFINHCLFQFRSRTRSRCRSAFGFHSCIPLVVLHIVGFLLVAAIQLFSFCRTRRKWIYHSYCSRLLAGQNGR